MPAFGAAGLTQIPGAVYKVEQSGFATYDVSFSGVVVGAIPFVQGDQADDYPNVVLMSISLRTTGTQCDHTQVDLHYEGKDNWFTTPETSLDLSIDFTTSQEPIESHIDFVTKIGGQPSNRLHGANFDSQTLEFIGFPVVDPDEPDALPSRFAGVRSYLMPQETYTYNAVDTDYPSADDISSIGKIFNPEAIDGTPLPLPELPGTRNWLSTGIRVQNIANVYFKIQGTGMLSGPRAWIPEIYGEEESDDSD